MARPLWTGVISFGLINIPVMVMSAKEGEELHFNLLDKRDHSRIGYKQINKRTGEEVDRKNIVKGYEYEPDQFVILTDQDFERANPKATQTIDIQDSVELKELDPLLFEKPYYLLPGKGGKKAYVLLRKVLEETGKVAIAKIVMFRKQRLVALMPRDDFIIMEVLRYAHQILSTEEADVFDQDLKEVQVNPRELTMAKQLVEGMTAEWNPDKYKDTYFDDVMKMIESKVKKGVTVESEKIERPRPTGQVVDLMPLLQKSLQAAKEKKKRPSTRGARKRA